MEKYHLLGIGGIGMSGLARLLLKKTQHVSGSDIAENPTTASLATSGAKIFIGHSAKHIVPGMTVVYSTDIKKENPEYQAALQLKCKMMHRSELLQKLMEPYKSLAVAGTHGKTTTSSLLAWVLTSSGFSPSFAIGGVIPQLQGNAGHGDGKYFVAEACESDSSFLNYSPFGAIVTNIDLDHMDHYKTEEALLHTFKEFISKVQSPKHLFWCADDTRLHKLNPPGISYGCSEEAKLRVSNIKQNGWTTSFDLHYNQKTYTQVEISLAGKHNVLNAAAVFGLALSLGIEPESIYAALRTFGGVLRRCEKKGEIHGIQFIDDYGHHPTEIRAVLNAIRNAIGERRLVVVYQPHRYSRALGCLGLYSGVFNDADEVYITEIYAARETPIEGVSHDKIIAEIKEDLGNRCHHISREKAPETLSSFLRPHDVVVTLGAGDITKLSQETIALINLKGLNKLKLGVVFGGASVEHEVSIMSVENMLQSLNHAYYDLTLFGITKKHQWISGSDAIQRLKNNAVPDNTPKITGEIIQKLSECDIIFPVIHGTYGEDGTLQGLFEMLGKAYVGCDYRASSIAMDKVLTKRLAKEAGVPSADYVSFTQYEWKTAPQEKLEAIRKELKYPLFVKPVHLGSSVGVYKVFNEAELLMAISSVFRLDDRIVIETGIEGREIEFSLLGNGKITVFPPGETFPDGMIYTYEGKYGPNATESNAKVNLPTHLLEEGLKLATTVYRAIGGKGLSRIDTFLDKNGKYWLNEVNPIPGMTPYSMFPQNCKANGLSMPELIDYLIILGLERKREVERLSVNR